MEAASDSSPSPIHNRVASEEFFPDYSGGTMPDLHRLPFYALAGTQELVNQHSTDKL
jgi:hypothetical protein